MANKRNRIMILAAVLVGWLPVPLLAQVMNDNFNSGAAGSQWQSLPSPRFDNPCSASPDGTTHVWFGADQPAPRIATTVPLNVSAGGEISFRMRYASQGESSPCEGPDEPDEGVNLQYRVNGGNWTEIQYWDPVGGFDPVLTSWQLYTIAIPAAAQTASTQFRWAQLSSTSTEFDHWGLDDVKIGLCNAAPTIARSADLNARSNVWPLDTAINLGTAYTLNVNAESVRWQIKYPSRPGYVAIANPANYKFEGADTVVLKPTYYCGGQPIAFTPDTVRLIVRGGFDQEIQVKWPRAVALPAETADDRGLLCDVYVIKPDGRILFKGATDWAGKLLVKGIAREDIIEIEGVKLLYSASGKHTVTQSAATTEPIIISLSPLYRD